MISSNLSMVSEPTMEYPSHVRCEVERQSRRLDNIEDKMQWIKEAIGYLLRAKFGEDVPLALGIPVRTREELLETGSKRLPVLQMKPHEPPPDHTLKIKESKMELLLEEHQKSDSSLENIVEHLVCNPPILLEPLSVAQSEHQLDFLEKKEDRELEGDHDSVPPLGNFIEQLEYDQLQMTVVGKTYSNSSFKQTLRKKRISILQCYHKARHKITKRSLWKEIQRLKRDTYLLPISPTWLENIFWNQWYHVGCDSDLWLGKKTSKLRKGWIVDTGWEQRTFGLDCGFESHDLLIFESYDKHHLLDNGKGLKDGQAIIHGSGNTLLKQALRTKRILIKGSKDFVWTHLGTLLPRKCAVLELHFDVLDNEEYSGVVQDDKSWLVSIVSWDTPATILESSNEAEVIQTYVFWNGHEFVMGLYNFKGRYDLVKFLKLVGLSGLYLHLCIGSHVCVEWMDGNHFASAWKQVRLFSEQDWLVRKKFKTRQEMTRFFTCSPHEIILGCDLGQCTCSSNQVEFVAYTFSYTTVQAFSFEEIWREIGSGIKEGNHSSRMTLPKNRKVVSTLLGPNLSFASHIEENCLQRESNLGWFGLIPMLWSNAKYISSTMTGSMLSYRNKLRHDSGVLLLLSADYGSFESWIGVNVDLHLSPIDVSFVVVPTFSYSKFIPLYKRQKQSEIRGDFVEDKTVPLSQVKLGHEYELVLVTFTGLYRFKIGDIVEVIGFHKATLKIRSIKRRKLIMTINIDKNTEKDQRVVDKMYWKIKGGADNKALEEGCTEMDAVFMDYGYVVLRCLNSIGQLELRVGEQGTFLKVAEQGVGKCSEFNLFKILRFTTNSLMISICDDFTVKRTHGSGNYQVKEGKKMARWWMAYRDGLVVDLVEKPKRNDGEKIQSWEVVVTSHASMGQFSYFAYKNQKQQLISYGSWMQELSDIKERNSVQDMGQQRRMLMQIRKSRDYGIKMLSKIQVSRLYECFLEVKFLKLAKDSLQSKVLGYSILTLLCGLYMVFKQWLHLYILSSRCSLGGSIDKYVFRSKWII